MAQDKKAVEGTEVTETTEGQDVNLKLTRWRITTNDKRKMWAYGVKGSVSKRDVSADFAASDVGGYELLDLLFEVAEEAKHDVLLVLHDEKRSNMDGTSTTYTVYEAQTTDADGNELICPVKPRQGSDRALLTNLLTQLRKGGVTA